MPIFDQGNEVYGGASSSAGIFLHRSSDDAVVKGGQLSVYGSFHSVLFSNVGRRKERARPGSDKLSRVVYLDSVYALGTVPFHNRWCTTHEIYCGTAVVVFLLAGVVRPVKCASRLMVYLHVC